MVRDAQVGSKATVGAALLARGGILVVLDLLTCSLLANIPGKVPALGFVLARHSNLLLAEIMFVAGLSLVGVAGSCP